MSKMSEERSYLFGDGDGFGDYDGFMETCWMPEDDKDIDAIHYLLTNEKVCFYKKKLTPKK